MIFLRVLAFAFFLFAGMSPASASPWDEPPTVTNPANKSLDRGQAEGGAKVAVLDTTPAASERTITASPRRDKTGGKIARGAANSTEATSQAVRIVLGLTILAVLPALLVCVTSFLRTIIVLSMLRHAIGMQETPPNTVLIGLALFLTLFTMSPVLQKVNESALQPYLSGKLATQVAFENASSPLRDFMVRQTREADLGLMVELSKAKPPKTMDDISNVQLAPAFMLSELRAAFQIGFVIFLPFLLIDLIVSSVLMALGMMMMPPTTIAMPLKILMFVLVDGWSLVLKALVGSFH
ncbi:MAG: flagellar type III secretion system pore protein FliP [Massilia sp.]